MTILLIGSYFKIMDWIYRGILRVLVKNSLNKILIPPNFGRTKIWGFEGIKRNECSLLLILFSTIWKTQMREWTFHSLY